MKNKTYMTIITVLVLSLGLWCSPARAGNIEAILDSLDNTSAFVVQDSALTELFRISGDGNVGIGTTAPSEKLVVSGNTSVSGNSTIGGDVYLTGAIRWSGAQALGISGTEIQVGSHGSWTNLNLLGESMHIVRSTGNVGIGTTAPSQKLDVVGTANMTTLSIGGTAVTTSATELNFVDGVTSAIQTQLDALGTGNGDLMADGTVAMTGNFRLGGNYLSNDGGDEGVFVSTTGNVGIGMTAPSSNLEVAGGTDFGVNGNGNTLHNFTGKMTMGHFQAGTHSFYSWNLSPILDLKQYNRDGDDIAIRILAPDGFSHNVGDKKAILFQIGVMNDNRDGARITNIVEETPSSGTLWKGGLGFETGVNGVLSEVMRVSSSGNVGIGTTNPLATLELSGATPELRINGAFNKILSPDDNYIEYYAGHNQAAGYGHRFIVDLSREVMRIEGNGRVGIGVTAPTQALDVDGTANMTALSIGGTAVTATATELNYVDGVTSDIQTQLDSKGTGSGDLLADGTVSMTGNFRLGNNYLSNDGGSEGVFVGTTGNVGIGMTAPVQKLEVAGNIAFDGGTPRSISGEHDVTIDIDSDNNQGSRRFQVTKDGGTIDLVTINENGTVGIGTTAPAQALDVVGTINASVDVTVGGASVSTGAHTTDTTCDSASCNITNTGTLDGFNLDQNVLTTSSPTFTGLFTSGNVGIGTTAPSNRLDVLSTTTQLRLSYDANSYATALVGSDSDLTITSGEATGRISLNPGDSDNFVTLAGGARLITYSSDSLEYGSMYHDGSDLHITTAGTVAGDVIIDKNLGVGTSGPEHLLHVHGSEGRVKFTDTDTRAIFDLENDIATPAAGTEMGRVNFAGNDDAGAFEVYARVAGYVTDDTAASPDGYLSFFTDEAGTLTEQMRINNLGNIGIGTTAPAEALDVSGNIQSTAYYYASDVSLKQKIAPLKGALEKVLGLRGVYFEWKDSGRPSIGVIAQEVEKVLPELVSASETTGIKRVEYGNLTAVLIEAVKELKAEIDHLRDLTAVQQQQIEELQGK